MWDRWWIFKWVSWLNDLGQPGKGQGCFLFLLLLGSSGDVLGASGLRHIIRASTSVVGRGLVGDEDALGWVDFDVSSVLKATKDGSSQFGNSGKSDDR